LGINQVGTTVLNDHATASAAPPDPPAQASPDRRTGGKGLLYATFSRSAPATSDNVARLRRAVAGFARQHDASERLIESVSLALSEALTNAAVHAYRHADEPGPVTVTAAIDNASLLLIVADEGLGMAPRPDSPGLGLGLGLMATLADRFEIDRDGNSSGVVLRLTFPLDA
jgi:serine/threonine-protein kinase RsbW